MDGNDDEMQANAVADAGGTHGANDAGLPSISTRSVNVKIDLSGCAGSAGSADSSAIVASIVVVSVRVARARRWASRGVCRPVWGVSQPGVPRARRLAVYCVVLCTMSMKRNEHMWRLVVEVLLLAPGVRVPTAKSQVFTHQAVRTPSALMSARQRSHMADQEEAHGQGDLSKSTLAS